MKNILDSCVGGIFWYICGWGFAFGTSGEDDKFIGTCMFFPSENDLGASNSANGMGYAGFFF